MNEMREHLGRVLSGGESAVDFSDAARDRYAMTTSPSSTRPLGIVFPCGTEDVRAVVGFARKNGVPLYPISRGKNWGYGDALAPSDGFLIVDLSRMNRICEVNERLTYAVIEPGVSQGQLYEYLSRRNIKLWMDGNGAGPDASIVGNVLERGFGHTPMGERSNHCCGLEAVLGSGELLRTGFGDYPGAKATYTYKPGVGPSMDGLFFQSNYGIVTKLGIWLMPAPEAFRGFICKLKHPDERGHLIDKLGELRRAGVLRSTVHMGNALRILASQVPYPWHVTHGKIPVRESMIQEWRASHDVAPWTATGAVYGPRLLVEGSMKAIIDAMKPLEVIELHDAVLKREVEAPSLDPLIGILQGNSN